jgi:hypothetical protein
MALEWLGNLAKSINDVLTTPSQQATQVAEQLPENNPYRLPISQMTGTPSMDDLQKAANWDINTRDFNARTLPADKTIFTGFNPNNRVAQVLGQNPGRYNSDIVTGAFDTEDKLKQQADLGNAVQSVIGAIDTPEFRTLLQSAPDGQNTLKLLDAIKQYPNVFGLNTAINTYTSANQFAQGITNANKKLAEDTQYIQAQSQNIDQLLNSIPDSADKRRVAYNLQKAKTREDFDAAWNEAKGLVPKQPSYKDQLDLKKLKTDIDWRNSETWRNYNVFPEGSGRGGDVNFWSRFGFGSTKDASTWATNLENAYSKEMQKNGGKLIRNKGSYKWVFPNGKPSPTINSWISNAYGEDTFRKYKAVRTNNQAYLDPLRSITGIQTLGLIQNEDDLAADKLVTQFESFTQAMDYAITQGDKKTANLLVKRYNKLGKGKKGFKPRTLDDFVKDFSRRNKVQY